MACKCYHADRNFLGKIGVCWGTKECEACSCDGNEAKCDFYDYVRKKAMKLTTDSETQKVKGKWEHYGLTLYREVCLDSIKCSCCKESFTYNPDEKIFKYCPYCGSKMTDDEKN